MSLKNSGPAQSERRIETLPAKPASAKDSRDVRGGKTSGRLFGSCCQGKHYDKAILHVQ